MIRSFLKGLFSFPSSEAQNETPEEDIQSATESSDQAEQTENEDENKSETIKTSTAVALATLFLIQGFFISTALAQELIVIPPTIVVPDREEQTTAKPHIRGVSPNNTVVEVYVDGILVGSVETLHDPSGTGSFSFGLQNPLSTGRHNITTRAVDGEAVSIFSETKIITIVPFGDPTLLMPETSTHAGVFSRFDGVAHNNSIIHVFIDNERVDTFSLGAHASGAVGFTHTLSTPITGGGHVIFLQAEDSTGRKSVTTPAKLFGVEEPYIPPTLVRVMGTNALPTVGGVAHNDSTIRIYVDGILDSVLKPANHESGTLYFEGQLVDPLSPGRHTITARALDSNGKPSLDSNALVYVAGTGTVGEIPAEITPIEQKPIIPPVLEETPEVIEEEPVVPDVEEEVMEEDTPEEITVIEEDTGTIDVIEPDIPGTIDQEAATTSVMEETVAGVDTTRDDIIQTVTNWPLIIGLIILIGLALIFIFWYLGQKRKLLNEGIDKLFSDDEEFGGDAPTQAGESSTDTPSGDTSPPPPSDSTPQEPLPMDQPPSETAPPSLMPDTPHEHPKEEKRDSHPKGGRDSSIPDDIPPPPPAI